MSFSLTTTGVTLQELAANLLAAARQFSTTEPTETTGPKSTPRVSRKTTEATSTAGTPPSSATPGPTGTPASTSTSAPAATATPAATGAPTLDEVRAALQPLLRDEDLSGEVSKLVVAQGATKLSLLPADKYAALLESAKPFLAQLAAKAVS